MPGIRHHLVLPLAAISLCLTTCGSDPTGRCLFNHMVGEMTIDPETIPASRMPEAEVMVQVHLVADGCKKPLEGATIEIYSSHYYGGEQTESR